MFQHYIQKYINNLTINDVYDYAFKNNIELTKNEADIIFKTIKTDWKNIIYSDHYLVLYKIKNNLRTEVYTKINSLIIENKEKYKKYLK